MAKRQWLSEGAEALVRELEASAAQEHDCDLLIVGSGYGGAVAAARLAGARPREGGEPIRVVVLERGREYLPGMFPSRFAEVPGHVRFSGQDGRPPRGRAEALFDLRLGEHCSVLVANGLGGGSLVNAAVMERPRPEAFARDWPAGITLDTLADPYRSVEHMLQVDDFAATDAPPKLASLFALGEAMCADEARRARLAIHPAQGATPAGVDREPCLHCGDCVSGCNHQAKNSLDVNYLALARANGARFYCGATVHRVLPRTDGLPGWTVEFFHTDRTKAYAEDEALIPVRARRVVLAAGALGSTEILLRSGAAGLPLSTALGTRFSGNGDAIAAVRHVAVPAHASAREDVAPAARGIGPTIGGMVFKERDDAPADRNPWLLYQEFAIPAALRRVLGGLTATAGLAFEIERADVSQHRSDFHGEDPDAAGDDALERTAIIGMQGDDGAPAALTLVQPAGVLCDAQLRIDKGDVEVHQAQLEVLAVAQAASPALAGVLVPNPLWQPLPLLTLERTTTVHPLGGCRMADRAADGVVDAFGRVWNPAGGVHDGLVVLDGAIVPGALGVNPALTIAALAERAIPELRRCWDLGEPPAPLPVPQRQPSWAEPPGAQANAPTVVELRERLTGTLQVGGTAHDASLTVEFAPIADLQDFVQRLPRRVRLSAARLELTRAGQAPVVLHLDGIAEVLHRADRSAEQRRAAVEATLPPPPPDVEQWISPANGTHVGELRTIVYLLTLRGIAGAGADFPWREGDRLRLRKRLEYALDAGPWRQLSEAQVQIESGGCTREAGRLCLDVGYFVEQAIPLLRVLAQQDQPNALGDLAALALFVLRLVLKTHWPNLLEALIKSAPPTAAHERAPGALRWRDGDTLHEVAPQPHPFGAAPTRTLLSRYLPPGGALRGRPVVLIHGLGASGSTFAHWSIGARPGADGMATSDNLVVALLRAGREVWVLELRTSIAFDDQRVHWALEEVAAGDIVPAIDRVLEIRHTEPGPPVTQVDVVAHCIGAAMFCVAVLGEPAPGAQPLHAKIGAVVLSQVGPLLRMGAMNRFRGYLASYLRQFVQAERFDVRPEEGNAQRLVDAILSTFPYPPGDRERERAKDVPGFELIRHRADAIWGRLMELDQVGDATLAALDAIYGWVMVRTLAQTIHFARHQLLTDVNGANRVVTQANLAERFAFPVLLLHGQLNAMFDWQGSYDSWRLLKQTFRDDDGVPPAEPPRGDGLAFGAGTRRRLRVVAGYGHQDCLIGRRAHADVFPHVVDFLAGFDGDRGAVPSTTEPQLVADLPWIGPTLGWVHREADAASIRCRLGIRASPARAATVALVFVPARQRDGRWAFDLDHAVAMPPPDAAATKPVDVRLSLRELARHDGVAVFTLHDDIPVERPTKPRILRRAPSGLFVEPAREPDEAMRAAVQRTLAQAGDTIELAILRFDPAWIAAADPGQAQPSDGLCVALASCQYPAGLLDRAPAQQSLERLARRLRDDHAPRPQQLLLVGDQIYADEFAGLFEPREDQAHARSHEMAFRLPAWRAVTRALPTAFVLDDHEVVDNWEPGRDDRPELQARTQAALHAYREHQHKLAPDRAAEAPFRYRLFPAGFPFFVLDARSARESRVLRPGAKGVPLAEARIVPDAVFAELEAWLAACPADVPKFIVSPSLVFPLDAAALEGAEPERLGLDSWSGFPASLVRLVELIARGGHQHVVFLSGDAHLSLVASFAIDLGGGRSLVLHSVVSSGLHAPWPFANTPAQDLALDGSIAFRHRGATAFAGTMQTAALGTAQGYALIWLRRDAPPGTWTLAVELDLADATTVCERRLGPAGPLEAWRTRRFSA